MDLVVALDDAGDGTGGKAIALRRLRAAGVPVPDGFVITHAALVAALDLPPALVLDPIELARLAERIETTALPPALEADVVARATALGEPFAVRSSVSIEDGDAGSAAGVFSSKVAVPIAGVWPAIRAVWASACTPLVVAYARRNAIPRVEIAVVVQRFVAGERVTVYTRPPARPDSDDVWIQRASAIAKIARAAAATDPVGGLALAAERAISAAGGADVELIAGDDTVVVQARPIVRPRPRTRQPAPAPMLQPLIDSGLAWSLDIAHDPFPLSPAQAGLVARVDAARIAPYRMCTVAGYLYATAPSRAVAPPDESFADVERAIAGVLGRDEPPSVADAIDRYLAFYDLWANRMAPLVAAARAAVVSSPGRRPSSIAATIAAAARGELAIADVMDRIGDAALAWDVAVPTLREQPHLVDAAIAAARATPPLPPADDAATDDAGDLGERDDHWFARAQAMVRRALLAAAARLQLADADDVFWIPLDDVASGHAFDPDSVAARARGARKSHERARDFEMPLRVPFDTIAPPQRTDAWHGAGAGGRAIGRVHRIDHVATPAPAGAIVVARAITPALAIVISGAGGVVAETGGPLDHGAAIARELGLPFVVDCRGAWHDLADGEIVEVIGDEGLVRRRG